MKQIQISDETDVLMTPRHCDRCGGLARLIGSEPHPVTSGTDLLTFVCTFCDEFLVLPIKAPASHHGWLDS